MGIFKFYIMNKNIMKKIILVLLINFTLFSSSFSQKLDYNEILQKNKNIQSAYLNENSMLLISNNETFKVIDVTNNRERDLNIKGYMNAVYQAKNDQYFIPCSIGEFNNKGVLIDKDGNRKEVQLSTYLAKISEDGKYIITSKKTVFGDGQFQIIDTKTMENQNTPKRKYSSFIADFIDAERIFLLYQSSYKEYNKPKIDSFENEYRENIKTRNLSKSEFKEIKKRYKKDIQKYIQRVTTAKYLIYNLKTGIIENEEDLIANNNKYKFFDEIIKIAIPLNGQEVLISAFNEKEAHKPIKQNRLLKIDISNYKINDLTDKIGLSTDDGITNIFFVNNNEFVLLTRSIKGIGKYFYSTKNILYHTELDLKKISIENLRRIVKEDEKIILIDKKNNFFEWEYKKRTIKKIINKYPVYLFDGKVKIEEIQE